MPQAIRAPAMPAGSLFMVVDHGVDHKGRSATRENRIRAVAHRNARRDYGRLGGSVRGNGNVRHVAGVRAVRIHQAMMLHVRIEVASGRGERRAFAFRDGVNVDAVIACVFPNSERP